MAGRGTAAVEPAGRITETRAIANRLRMGNIPESYVYPPHARRIMDILQDRMNQIKTRTQIVNRQHSILDKYDYKMTDSGSSDSTGKKCQDYLMG